MKRRFSAGYTIVEVLIVLAVSGMLLSSVILMLSGKQAQTEAVESVRALDSTLSGLSREVASGYYTSGYSCTASAPGAVVLGGGGFSGANTGCIFIGKLMNFTDTQALTINLLGRQFINSTSTTDVSSLIEAQPVKVVDVNTLTGVSDDTSTYTYPYGLKVMSIFDSSGTTKYKALAFVVELAGSASSTNSTSGSRSIVLYGVAGTVDTNTSGKSIPVSNLVPLTSGAIICMETGNGKNAELTIGVGGNQYSTNTLIDSGVEDVCK